MKRYLFALTAAAAVLAGCNNGLEKDPDDVSGGSTYVGPESISQEHWEALADSCTFVMVNSFMNKGTGTFNTSPNDINKETWNAYWQQGPSIEVLLASYERIKSTQANLASTYLTYFQKWFDNDANNYNNTYDSAGGAGHFYNQWNDDMGAIGIALLHMADVTGEAKYAQTAKDLFDTYVWPQAKTNSKGTGLPWTSRAEDKDNLNSTANNTNALVAITLYNRYKEAKYLTIAKTLYNFNVANMPDEERVEEPPLSYTQGYFAETARLLYHATGEQAYMDKAGKVLTYCFRSTRCADSSTGILRHEGTDVNQSIFKSIYIPYAVNFVLDGNASSSDREYLYGKILLCADTLDKHLDRKTFPQMYCDYFWGTTFTTGVPSLGAQVSGASLMEGTARMVKSYKK